MAYERGSDPLARPEVRWTLGCLIAAVAVGGSVLLVVLFAIFLQPPAWLQIVVGVGLALGGAIFAWLVANALGEGRGGERGPRPVRPSDHPRDQG